MSEPIRRETLEKLFGEVTWGDQLRAEKAVGPKGSDAEKTARMLFEAAIRLGEAAPSELFDAFTDRIVLADMVGLTVPGMGDEGDDDAPDPQ